MFAAVFGGNKYEDAAELLEKACNNYKLAKMWREAASGFELLADCHLKSDSKHDAASAMVDAANANKKVNVDAAVANLRKAVEYFNDLARSARTRHTPDRRDRGSRCDARVSSGGRWRVHAPRASSAPWT